MRNRLLVCSLLAAAFALPGGPALAAADWTQMQPPGALPPPRIKPAMAQFGNKTILFGGGDATETNLLGDTWSWDGARWTQITQFALFGGGPSPSPRIGAAMAFNPDTGQAVLFGGKQDFNELLNDTWILAFVTNPLVNRSFFQWTKLTGAPTDPSVRKDANLEYDPATKTIILSGGRDSGGVLQDTWSFDPVARTWSHLPFDQRPMPVSESAGLSKCGLSFSCGIVNGRANCAAVAVPSKLLLFGGQTNAAGAISGSSWTFSTPSDPLVWTGPLALSPSPPPRTGTGMAYYPVSGEAILYGGTGNGHLPGLSDTWGGACILGFAPAWTQGTPAHNPGQRLFHGMATGPDGLSVVVFGGLTAANGTSNDTWTWGQQVACIPGDGSKLAEGDEVKCLFTTASGVRFEEWKLQGFDAPGSKHDAMTSFRAEGHGSASITARWRDDSGKHEQTLDYEITRHHDR